MTSIHGIRMKNFNWDLPISPFVCVWTSVASAAAAIVNWLNIKIDWLAD